MKSSPRCDGATTASLNDHCEGRQDNAARSRQPRSQITRSLTSTLPHFGHRRCSKDSSTSSETPNPGSPFTPRRSLVRRSNSQASSEVSPALSDILRSIPTRHGPQSWRQKRCRSARIIVYQVKQQHRFEKSRERSRVSRPSRSDFISQRSERIRARRRKALSTSRRLCDSAADPRIGSRRSETTGSVSARQAHAKTWAVFATTTAARPSRHPPRDECWCAANESSGERATSNLEGGAALGSYGGWRW